MENRNKEERERREAKKQKQKSNNAVMKLSQYRIEDTLIYTFELSESQSCGKIVVAIFYSLKTPEADQYLLFCCCCN